MTSRYGGITGNKRISEDFQNINTAFENVQSEMDANKTVVDNHLSSTIAHKAEDITYQGDAAGNNVKQALNEIDNRIDNLILESGDSSPEVADARGGYPVLGDRLNAYGDQLNELEGSFIVYNIINYNNNPTEAINAINDTGGILFSPPGAYEITSNLTVPSNVTLWFAPGSVWTVNTGITLTINGGIKAGQHRLFSGEGTVGGRPTIPYSIPQWFGATGTTSGDAGTAINKALNLTKAVYIPATTNNGLPNYYSIVTTVILTDECRVFSDPGAHPVFLPYGKCFDIRGSNISIDNIDIDCQVTTDDTHSVYYFNTNLGSISRVRIRNSTIIYPWAVIRDSNHSTNIVTDFYMDDVMIKVVKGPPILTRDFWAFIHYHKVVVDFTASPAVPTFYGFWTEGAQGVCMVRCDVLGYGPGPGNAASHGFVFADCQAVWLDRLAADTVGGRGYLFDGCEYVEGNGILASLCGAGGLLFSGSSKVSLTGIYAGGRKGLSWAPSSAPGVEVINSPGIQLSDMRLISNTGDGLKVSNSSRGLFLNIHTTDNGDAGIREAGTSSLNFFTSVFSYSNVSASGVLIASTSNITNWKPASGTYIPNTVGPATV